MSYQSCCARCHGFGLFRPYAISWMEQAADVACLNVAAGMSYTPPCQVPTLRYRARPHPTHAHPAPHLLLPLCQHLALHMATLQHPLRRLQPMHHTMRHPVMHNPTHAQQHTHHNSPTVAHHHPASSLHTNRQDRIRPHL